MEYLVRSKITDGSCRHAAWSTTMICLAKVASSPFGIRIQTSRKFIRFESWFTALLKIWMNKTVTRILFSINIWKCSRNHTCKVCLRIAGLISNNFLNRNSAHSGWKTAFWASIWWELLTHRCRKVASARSLRKMSLLSSKLAAQRMKRKVICGQTNNHYLGKPNIKSIFFTCISSTFCCNETVLAGMLHEFSKTRNKAVIPFWLNTYSLLRWLFASKFDSIPTQ